jgi:hypothetical protein
MLADGVSSMASLSSAATIASRRARKLSSFSLCSANASSFARFLYLRIRPIPDLLKLVLKRVEFLVCEFFHVHEGGGSRVQRSN